ncbi:MAG: SPFH domain-containing protein [Planctomycetota bacterium]|jgi:membrane protease subunit HflK
MAEPTDQQPQQPWSEGDVPVEGLEPMEVEAQPRRAASARFVVETDVGSEAALREAMDPANQSLADALRLSFRVLQVVIVVLVVLFLISGFRTVQGGESGVMLRFGRIVEVDGREDLEPGLRRNLLPYPAGEFIIFDVENRAVNLADTFWPKIPANMTLDRAIEHADVRSSLKPGEVGTVLTNDGDLAHFQLKAEYQIDDPVRYVKQLKLGDAGRIVELALQRAAVQAAVGLSLQELVDQPEEAAARIKQGAQGVLDSLDCGVQLTGVQLPDTTPPFAIVKVYRDLQNAREEAREVIEKARQDADEELIEMAGPNHRAMSELIDGYEEAEDLGDAPRAEALLGEINTFLESDRARGEVREIIDEARAYESQIERTLGSEARQFANVLRQYRDQPGSTVRRLWVEARKWVLARGDIEIFRVHPGFGSIEVIVSGSEDIAEIRRKNARIKREREAAEEAADLIGRRTQRAEDIEPGQARPALERGEDGRIRPRGSGQ